MLIFGWFLPGKSSPKGSGWNHFGHMLRSCGVIVVTWGALGALGGRSWRTWSSKKPREGSKRPRGKPKVRIGGVNRGTEGHQGGTEGRRGATRVWVGGVGAANGGYRGKLLEFLERIQHALTMHKAWGGGFKMPSAHAADLL